MICNWCEGTGSTYRVANDRGFYYMRGFVCEKCKGSGMMDNYPTGYSGEEGREEETFMFYLNGEVEVEHYTEEEALEELLDMTVREALMKGLSLD